MATQPTELRPGVTVVAFSSSAPDDQRRLYRSGTLALVKELRAAGFKVDYDIPEGPHPEIGLFAHDWFPPILAFGGDESGRKAFDLAIDWLLKRLSRWRSTKTRSTPDPTLHVKWGLATNDAIEWFEAEGPATGVIAALRERKRSGNVQR